MNSSRPLQGGCSCGRNRYIIQIPQDTTSQPQVFFSNIHSHRMSILPLYNKANPPGRSQATPLSAWLRVPLAWYQSTTTAYLSDETHAAIRRSYTGPQEESCKRHFCGFCGTPLSYWSESPPEEKEFISVTLGSLSGDDLRSLEELGLFDAAENEGPDGVLSEDLVGQEKDGLPWFETLVEGSKLGNMQRSWGSTQSGNGRVKVEWEIVEWTDDGETEILPAKRKIGEVEEHDSKMEGVLPK